VFLVVDHHLLVLESLLTVNRLVLIVILAVVPRSQPVMNLAGVLIAFVSQMVAVILIVIPVVLVQRQVLLLSQALLLVPYAATRLLPPRF
jgi:hypothetical protein